VALRTEGHPAVDVLAAGPEPAYPAMLNLHFGFVSQNTIASFSYHRVTFDPCWPAMTNQSLLRAWYGRPR